MNPKKPKPVKKTWSKPTLHVIPAQQKFWSGLAEGYCTAIGGGSSMNIHANANVVSRYLPGAADPAGCGPTPFMAHIAGPPATSHVFHSYANNIEPFVVKWGIQPMIAPS